MPPVARSTSATAACTAASSTTSRRNAMARPGAMRSNSVAASALRVLPATRSPRRNAASASARPRPELTPVMNQVFMSFLLPARRGGRWPAAQACQRDA